MATVLGHRPGKSSKSSRLKESILLLNKWRVCRAKKKFLPEEIVALCPHCVQNSQCVFKIMNDPVNCRKCGKCSVKDLVEITSYYRVPIYFVAGGSAAVSLVKNPKIKAVVAVACGNELFSGFLRIFRKNVITVHIEWPNGPCKDTFVDYKEVEKGIKFLLGMSSEQWAVDSAQRSAERK